jgi:hypothetical protein
MRNASGSGQVNCPPRRCGRGAHVREFVGWRNDHLRLTGDAELLDAGHDPSLDECAELLLAMKQPQLFATDLQAFFRLLR